jgi:hypothetical protein
MDETTGEFNAVSVKDPNDFSSGLGTASTATLTNVSGLALEEVRTNASSVGGSTLPRTPSVSGNRTK